MGECRDDILWRHAEDAKTVLGYYQATASMEYALRIGGITQTRAWLSVLPSTVNGTELGVQEWSDFLSLCYGIEPPDLPEHCNGCGAEFDIFHPLECK